MTAERRFDLLVAGELNPDILIVDPTSGPAFGQVETIVDAIFLAIGIVVGDRRLRCRPPRAADRLRGGRRRGRVRLFHAPGARGRRDRRVRLPDRPGGPDRRHGDRLPRGGPGQHDRDRCDRLAPDRGRPARAARRRAPPPRREHLPPAGPGGRPARAVRGGALARPDDVVRLQLGRVRDLGRPDRPAAPGGRRVPAEPRGGPADHRQDRRPGRRLRAHPAGDRRARGRPAVHPGDQAGLGGGGRDAGHLGIRGGRGAGPARRGRRHHRRRRLVRRRVPVRDARRLAPARRARAGRRPAARCRAPGSAGRPPSRPSSWPVPRSPQPAADRDGRDAARDRHAEPVDRSALRGRPVRARRGQPSGDRDARRRRKGLQRGPGGDRPRRGGPIGRTAGRPRRPVDGRSAGRGADPRAVDLDRRRDARPASRSTRSATGPSPS